MFSGVGFLTTVGSLSISNTANSLTLVNNLTSTGSATFAGVTVINGSSITIYIGGSITLVGNVNPSGTVNIVMNGTGTLSMPSISTSNQGFFFNLEFNTSGTITVSGLVVLGGNGRTIKYTSGTMNMSGSTVVFSDFNPNSVINVNCSGMIGSNSFNNVWISGTGITVTLLSNMYVSGTLYLGQSTLSGQGFNGSSYSVTTANLSSDPATISSPVTSGWNMTTGTATGTATIILNGTGSWTMNSVTTGYYLFPLQINTTGTTTIGNVRYGTGTITYVPNTGSVNTTGTLTIPTAAVSLNTNVMLWKNITMSIASTLTLLSDISMSGNLTMAAATTLSGAHNLYCAGFTMAANISGSSGFLGITINATGGTITVTGGTFQTNLTFDLGSGTLIVNSLSFSAAALLTYNSGNITISTPSLFTFASGATITCNALFNAPIGMLFSGNITVNGSGGFNIHAITCITAGSILTFQAGSTYTLTVGISVTGTAISTVQIKSSTPSSYTNLIVSNTGATQSVIYCTATDVDSHLGQTIWDVGGVLLRTINWNLWTAPRTVGSVN